MRSRLPPERATIWPLFTRESLLSGLDGGGRIEVGKYWRSPWLEVARLSSDTYQMVPGVGIWREAEGIDEWRFRAGAGLRIPLAPGLRVDQRHDVVETRVVRRRERNASMERLE